MVQSIARLGQHYLTSQSPVLRRRLLGLISTACAALHNNEDEFLPLVNDIWPVVIKRLYDEEAFVVIAASETVAQMCKCAGDFMSTRIRVEWHDMMKLARQMKANAEAERKGKHGRGIYSLNWQVWESMITLLITVVEYVRIEAEIFDEVLEILAEYVTTRKDVRTSLSAINADAVWLMEVNRGRELNLTTPILEGYTFTSIQS